MLSTIFKGNQVVPGEGVLKGSRTPVALGVARVRAELLGAWQNDRTPGLGHTLPVAAAGVVTGRQQHCGNTLQSIMDKPRSNKHTSYYYSVVCFF